MMESSEFKELIWQQAKELYRDMPWREDTRPYYVLVSEFMLQQTQVSRVVPKFTAFVERFPDEMALARASLADVLKMWQGLGYNRRAKFLHEAAKQIVELGEFPSDEAGLVHLPGVGKNTAGAILAYSFNQPVIFIETNIRTVYIHHFFNDHFDVDDKLIIEKLKETAPWAKGKEQPDEAIHSLSGAMRKTVGLSHMHPREFYWALMDYGNWLKTSGVRNVGLSKHYKKQSPLKGSLREVRGMILRELSRGDKSLDELRASLPDDERFEQALEDLKKENLIGATKQIIHLTK